MTDAVPLMAVICFLDMTHQGGQPWNVAATFMFAEKGHFYAVPLLV